MRGYKELLVLSDRQVLKVLQAPLVLKASRVLQAQQVPRGPLVHSAGLLAPQVLKAFRGPRAYRDRLVLQVQMGPQDPLALQDPLVHRASRASKVLPVFKVPRGHKVYKGLLVH